VEGGGFEVQGCHLLVGDFDALLIGIGIKLTGDGGTGLGGGADDQLDDGQVADQRLGAPVHGDEGKQLVLDAVPFTGAGWQMVHGDGDPKFIGQHLQFPLPQAHAVAIAAATVGIDQKSLGGGIARCAEHVPPAPYARHRERGGVVADPEVDPSIIGGDVVDP
jgi:hypothetical protein